MKKILTTVWILAASIFIFLMINYAANEAMIDKYENGIYENNSLAALGFIQPYISHYNQGNIYYKEEKYEKAIEEYRKALDKKPPKNRECIIRINLALAMVMPIEPDEVTEEKLDEIILVLDEARDVLTINGCAGKTDQNGHNAEAQKLKNDIDEFERQLKEKNNAQNKEKDGDDSKENNKGDNDGKHEEKRKQLEELEDESTKERNGSIGESRYYFDDFIYYDGPTW